MSKTRRFLKIGFLLGLLAAIVLIWVNRLPLYDWYRLRGYSPPAQISQIASETTMTAYARHMFYVNKPLLEDRSEFNNSCPISGGEQTIILGCYHAPETGIYIFKVEDPKLDGVAQVTAAHETLHAIYGRLSANQKSKINSLLEDFYQHHVKDKRLISTINAYKKSEPNDVVNEMHSIFGTEVSQLTPVLETYYKQYFTNRQKVVNFANQYQAAFTQRHDKIKEYDTQLQSLIQQIDTLRTSLASQLGAIEAQKAQMQSLLAAGKKQEYNSQVTSFNAKVVHYNQDAATTRLLIVQYNQLVIDRNAIALEENQLSKAINSQPSNISGQ